MEDIFSNFSVGKVLVYLFSIVLDFRKNVMVQFTSIGTLFSTRIQIISIFFITHNTLGQLFVRFYLNIHLRKHKASFAQKLKPQCSSRTVLLCVVVFVNKCKNRVAFLFPNISRGLWDHGQPLILQMRNLNLTRIPGNIGRANSEPRVIYW